MLGGDGGAPRVHDGLLRRQAAPLSRRRHRLSSPCTARSTTSRSPAPARFTCRAALHRRGGSRRSPTCGASLRRWRRGRAAGRSVVAGDTKVVERGKARRPVHHHDRHRRRRPRAWTSGRGAWRRATGCSSPGTIGDHGMAILVARGELALEGETRQRHGPAARLVASAAARAADGVRCMRDPTRGGLATTLNELALAAELSIAARRGRAAAAPAVAAPARSSASTRSTSPTRASSSRSSPPTVRPPRSPRCAPIRSAATPRSSVRCAPTPRRWSCSRRRSAARGSSTRSPATRFRGFADPSGPRRPSARIAGWGHARPRREAMQLVPRVDLPAAVSSAREPVTDRARDHAAVRLDEPCVTAGALVTEADKHRRGRVVRAAGA